MVSFCAAPSCAPTHFGLVGANSSTPTLKLSRMPVSSSVPTYNPSLALAHSKHTARCTYLDNALSGE
jgi:hypothetical protein